jgi:hypothetical protein
VSAEPNREALRKGGLGITPPTHCDSKQTKINKSQFYFRIKPICNVLFSQAPERCKNGCRIGCTLSTACNTASKTLLTVTRSDLRRGKDSNAALRGVNVKELHLFRADLRAVPENLARAGTCSPLLTSQPPTLRKQSNERTNRHTNEPMLCRLGIPLGPGANRSPH